MGPGQGWMHAKLLIVLALLGYHHSCGVLLRKFEKRADAAQPCLVPLVQRSAGADDAGRCHFGGGQAFLRPGNQGLCASQHWRKTTAWPLFWLYAVLIAYASLYPFDNWRFQGVLSWSFLTASWPRYWTGFDVRVQRAGLCPLGLFAGPGCAPQPSRDWPAITWWPLWWPRLCLSRWSRCRCFCRCACPPTSIGFERGRRLGRCVQWPVALAWAGLIERWGRFRDRWFESEASGALALLAVVALGFVVSGSRAFWSGPCV